MNWQALTQRMLLLCVGCLGQFFFFDKRSILSKFKTRSLFFACQGIALIIPWLGGIELQE